MIECYVWSAVAFGIGMCFSATCLVMADLIREYWGIRKK